MKSKILKQTDLTDKDFDNLVNLLKIGGLAVLPTDTIYGIHGSALSSTVVKKIYTLKRKDPIKPMIVIINLLDDLELFKIRLDKKTKKFLSNIWPNPISVILPFNDSTFQYLHRDFGGEAFRMPNNEFLQKLLKRTGPLISTSANLHNEPPAITTQDAYQFLGDQIKFYLDGGKLESPPSTIIKIDEGKMEIIRQGVIEIDPDTF